MKSIDFVNKAINIAKKYKTLYVLGCFGAPMNSTNKNRYTKNYSYNGEDRRRIKIINSSSDTFGFDCVCLIKGILWGWNADTSKTYGGAVYASNGVPDVGADEIMNYCYEMSSNFSNIQVGELVHCKGHVGIYIGNGLAVESTPIWDDGVQITAIYGVNHPQNYNVRKWENHGKLKFIDYSSNLDGTRKTIDEIALEVIDGKWDNGYARKSRLAKAGYDYHAVQKRVNEILAHVTNSTIEYYPIPNYDGVSIVDALKSIGVDSSFKNRSLIAIKNGMTSYIGTAEQNTNMLKLLKNGKLISR